ncbi:secreted protein [Melampsora americana]|nr:secreted protein [Melampsora americana]
MRTSLFICVTLIIIMNGVVRAMPTAYDNEDHPNKFSAYISPADQNQLNPITSAHQLPELTAINVESKHPGQDGLRLRTTEVRRAQASMIEAEDEFSGIRARKIASLDLDSDDEPSDSTILPLIVRVGNYRSASY